MGVELRICIGEKLAENCLRNHSIAYNLPILDPVPNITEKYETTDFSVSNCDVKLVLYRLLFKVTCCTCCI